MHNNGALLESVVCRNEVIHSTNTVKAQCDTFLIDLTHYGARNYEDKQALALIQ